MDDLAQVFSSVNSYTWVDVSTTGSYVFVQTWVVGSTILLIVMARAFSGYVFHWGHYHYLPVFSYSLYWWGLSLVNMRKICYPNSILSLHFILPFTVAGLRIVHLLFLHQTGRGNSLGVNRNSDKVSFYSYFSSKDVFDFRVLLLMPYFRGVWKLYSC